MHNRIAVVVIDAPPHTCNEKHNRYHVYTSLRVCIICMYQKQIELRIRTIAKANRIALFPPSSLAVVAVDAPLDTGDVEPARLV